MPKLQERSMPTYRSIFLIDQKPWYNRCDASYCLFLKKNFDRLYDVVLTSEDFDQIVTKRLIPQILHIPISFVIVPLMAGAMLCNVMERNLTGANDIPIITIPFSRHPIVTFSKDDIFMEYRSLIKYQEYAKSFSRQLKTFVNTKFTKRDKLNILLVDVTHDEGYISSLVESVIRRILSEYDNKFYIGCVINEVGKEPYISPKGQRKKNLPTYYAIRSQTNTRKASHQFFLSKWTDKEAKSFITSVNKNFHDCYYLWRNLTGTSSQKVFETFVCPSRFQHEQKLGISEFIGFLDEWRSWELEPKSPDERASKYFSMSDYDRADVK